MDENTSSEQSVSVRVALRVRPANTDIQQEVLRDFVLPRTAVHLVPDEPQIIIGKDESNQKSFTFDYVYGPNCSQSEIYDELAAPLVNQFLQGFNATILAYGQTFSGKTYTMGSTDTPDSFPNERGIIPRVFEHILSNLPEESSLQNIIKVSFLEIYQEQVIGQSNFKVRDLLMPSAANKDISIRENKGSIVVSGVHEEIINDIDDFNRCLVAGGIERTTGDTLMHLHSSRSHAIFTITLEQAQLGVDEIPRVVRRSKLRLVDLAGSERLKRTGAEGLRLKESVKINSGLLALGNVISILGDDSEQGDKQTHVPYRDSKLTRLLQDSLGGNSQTLMLACVSPLLDDVDETINTMKYANRARKIQNKPIVNVIDQMALERTNMQNKIDLLEGKLRGLESAPSTPAKVSPEMIDFDNEQLMFHFMDELKTRTIKGANAVKALNAAERDNELLRSRIEELESMDEKNKQENEVLKIRQGEIENALQKCIDQLLEFSLLNLKGRKVPEEIEKPVINLLRKTYPKEKLEEKSTTFNNPSLKSTPVAPISPPEEEHNSELPTSIAMPAINPAARRRRRIISEEEEGQLKPLEMELRETRKYLSQLETEYAGLKTQLQQSEAISEESSREIARLLHLNEQLRSSQQTIKEENRKVQEEKPMDSTEKILVDSNVQTIPIDSIPIVPAHTDNANPVLLQENQSIEKLAAELGTVTKAKVDLLKELSKLNKEAEKTRHAHADQIFRLEREIETLQGQLNNITEEQLEKDLMKDRAKEDYERKLKNQETVISKFKQKQKELEKALKDKGNGDKRLLETEQECEKLVSQIVSLKKKIKEDHEKFVDLENRKGKEIFVLNKQFEEELKKARQNEAKNEMLRKKLDRKTEELAAMHKKLRDASIPGVITRMNRNSFDGIDNDTFMESESTARQQIVVEDGHGNLNNELVLARSRMATIEKELENGRKSQELEKQRSEAVLQIAELRSGIKNHESSFLKNSLEWLELSEKFISDEEFSKMVEKMPNADLRQTQKFVIQTLAKIDALNNEIDMLQTKFKEDEDYKQQFHSLDKKMQKVVRAFEKKVGELQKELNDTKELNNSQSSALNRIHETSTAQIQTDPPESAESPVSSSLSLEQQKDLFYYRNANKELKSKLREVVAVNHRLAKTIKAHNEGNNSDHPSLPAAAD